jgi:hypothetical protein
MNTTSNLHLKKPSGTDPIDISVLNENADTLDAFAGETNTALAGKQDTIADISEIRSGAAAGATAVQPAEFEADQDRQDALEAEDRAALIQQVDSGSKNLFNIQRPSAVRNTEYNATFDGGVELTCSNAVWTQYIIGDIPVESGSEYDFTLYVDAISGTDAFRAYVRDTDSSGNVLYDSGNVSEVKTITRTIMPSSGKIWVGIYLNNSATAKTASAKIRAMLCTAADYAISPAFVPYRPSWQEMWEMIQALQSGS